MIRFHIFSKLKSLEKYYLRLLQLCMSWREENQLKEYHQSYEEKYMEGITLCQHKLYHLQNMKLYKSEVLLILVLILMKKSHLI